MFLCIKLLFVIMKYIIGLVLLLSISFQQAEAKEKTFTIKGQVYEQENGKQKPLPMAYIYVDNTIYCTYTNNNGSFEIDLPKGKHDIKVSFKGCNTETQTLNVKNSLSEINITLKNIANIQLADK